MTTTFYVKFHNMRLFCLLLSRLYKTLNLICGKFSSEIPHILKALLSAIEKIRVRVADILTWHEMGICELSFLYLSLDIVNIIDIVDFVNIIDIMVIVNIIDIVDIVKYHKYWIS